MKRYGEEFELTQETLDTIAILMNEDIREELHHELTDCTPDEFLTAYIDKDSEFENIIKSEFGIEL